MDFVYKFTTQNAKYIPESQQLTEEQKKIIGKVSVEISEIETISSSEKKYIGKASGTLEGLPVFKFNYDETTGLTTSIALQNDDTIPFVISGSFGVIGPVTGSGSSPYYQISGSVSNIINGNAVLLSDGEANLTPEGKQKCYESYADYIKRLFYQKYLTVYGKKLYIEVIGIETEEISNFVHQNEFKEPTTREETPKNLELVENKKPDFPPDKIYTFNVEKYGYLINPDIGTFSIILPDIPTETILGDIFPDDFDTDISLDDEFREVNFEGREIDPEIIRADSIRQSEGQELLRNLNTDDPNVAQFREGNNGDPNDAPSGTISTEAKGKIKKMLEVAQATLGYTEKYDANLTSNNRPGKDTKFGVYWGMNGHHYCGMFVCWCAEHAGMKVTKRDKSPYVAQKTSEDNGSMPNSIACPTGVKIFKSKEGCWLDNGSDKNSRKNSSVKPEPGDIVFFSWNYNNQADHVGIVVKDNGNGTVKCYEGNTSPGRSGANQRGSGCYERDRDKSTILGYGKTALWDPSNTEPFTGPAGKAASTA